MVRLHIFTLQGTDRARTEPLANVHLRSSELWEDIRDVAAGKGWGDEVMVLVQIGISILDKVAELPSPQ
jgi:hypothetical protein